MLAFQISLGKVLLLAVVAVCFLIYQGINSGFFFEEADGAYCAKTCQKRLAEAKNPTVKGASIPTEVVKKQIKTFEDRTREKNYISIKVSTACQKSGTCPTLKNLADQFDNSNKYLSGDFTFNNETGLWQREPPLHRNAFEHYKFMNNFQWIVWVDPDDYTWDRTKKIMIESQLHYIDDRDVIENQVRKEYKGLNMDGCKSATIGWTDGGQEVLLDVLNHFYSNCKEPLVFDPTIEIFMNSTIFPDCNRECFFYLGEMKKTLKVEFMIEAERIGELTKEEVEKPRCYGIYCDRTVEKTEEKTVKEQVADRLKELEDIDECKEYWIWDDLKIKGDYRRNDYNCNDEDERNAYLLLMRPTIQETERQVHPVTNSTNSTG